MKSYFTRWIDMSGIETFENLQDLILQDQLLFTVNRDLELFLREREPKSLEQTSRLADQYKESRYIDIVSLTFKLLIGQGHSQIQDQGQVHGHQEDNRWIGEDFQVINKLF